MINTPPGTKLISAKGKRGTVSADFSLTTRLDTLALRVGLPEQEDRKEGDLKVAKVLAQSGQCNTYCPLRLKLERSDPGHPCLANTADYTRECLPVGTVNPYRGEVGMKTVMNSMRLRTSAAGSSDQRTHFTVLWRLRRSD